MTVPVREDRPADLPPVRREPVFNLPMIVIVLIVICVGVHLVRTFILTVPQDLIVLVTGAFIPLRYSGAFSVDVFAFTTPFTYAFLHGSFTHLAVNMVWLAAFGSPLANRLGVARFSLFWAATGLAAAALHYVLHPVDQSPLIGASGAISGMMGAAARFGFQIDRSTGKAGFAGDPWPISAVFRSRGVMVFLAIWMIVNLLTGLFGLVPGMEDRIAWEAHIGGFVIGFLGVHAFDRPRGSRRA